MARALLVLWVSLFAVQTADLVAFVVPDDCVGDVSSSSNDSCPAGSCMRCICCAQVVAPITPVVALTNSTACVVVDRSSPTYFVPTPDPRRILHVPKTLA